MRTLNVALANHSYPIYIASGLRSHIDLLLAHIKSKRVAIVSNTTVAPLYLEPVLAALQSHALEVTPIILPDGEVYKNWETLNQIFDGLLQARCERSTTLIALGGGVTGDMTGFAAATYQRGIPFIQIPTTLLSQVDSSVGGKTAINHPLGKNMIGAFYQPKAVFIDINTLNTLPDRELKAGMAEVIKTALLRDAALLDWLERNMDALLARDPQALAYVVERCCQNKAEVVAADETEQAGRALLNLGHTFGHAIETGMGYGTWLHGEAVAAGTMMAIALSARLKLITPQDVARVRRIFESAGLPVTGPDLGVARYIELMQHDKKVVNGALRLILLQSLGRAIIVEHTPMEDIEAAIQACIV